MKKPFRTALSLLLALSLSAALAAPCAASEALGDDLTEEETLLHEETTLATNVFWSTANSDLRTENLITYIPNRDVTPIVTYGSVLTDRSTLSAAAADLEEAGYRVVAGINGDFYNTGNGLPVGIVITEGQLRSSDGGYYAIGFRSDGTALMGKPALRVSADLGYAVYDDFGDGTELLRPIAGVNKARQTGGIYLYTYDFNAAHTTGNTQRGVDVVCSVEDGQLAVGSTVTLIARRVVEAEGPTAVGPDEMVLSANGQSGTYYVDALRNLPLGSEITVTVSAADPAWEEADYAVGALYSLLENGAVNPSLPSGANPRTAVGRRSDGTLIFYTIDGRKSGHSIGATMTQVAERLAELGCDTALCLDGGGSTTLTVTAPDATSAALTNVPSEGGERAVSNQLFLVADGSPSGRLSHFYLRPDHRYVLAGSRVELTVSGVDTRYFPLERSYSLSADRGTVTGSTLTTPERGGTVTVTASGGGRSGSTEVYAVAEPDSLTIRSSAGTALSSLTLTPGSTAQLTAAAVYRHLPLYVDPAAVSWSFSGDVGRVDESGLVSASTPGSGTVTASAGGRSVSIPVTVSQIALRTVEDFESGTGTFSAGSGMDVARVTGAGNVARGRGALLLTYSGLADGAATARASLTLPSPYTDVTFWVRGDGSGNTLLLITDSGERTAAAVLDFTGWRQVSVTLPAGTASITGVSVIGAFDSQEDPETGALIAALTTPDAGSLTLDHFTASYGGLVDPAVPEVALRWDEESRTLTASISDAVDGTLAASAIAMTVNGQPYTGYTYRSGTLTAAIPESEDGRALRLTVTARDASGNIGRGSVDLPASAEGHRFADTEGYWAADYVDFLYDAGVTGGYSDGTFRPNQNITRAQFAVMLYRFLGLREGDYASVVLPFADADQIGAYAVPAIKALYTEGIITGSTGKDGRQYFNPNASLTRAQASAMIGRTQEKGYASAPLSFTDSAAIPAYAAEYIQAMAAQGILGGYSDGTFRPGSNITRGQMAKILYHLM